MIITEEMNKALDLIKSTNESIYITGKAGTGKTTFLKYIVNNINKSFVVTASTGVAAINADGMTLHSLLGIPLSALELSRQSTGGLTAQQEYLVQIMEVLVIDEISMVRPDVIDYIDRKLRKIRQQDVAFGGVQLIMFGDLYQLPPVVSAADEKIVMQNYRAPYFFYADVFKRNGFHVVELNHVFRQSDPKFVDILNRIRSYELTEQDIEDLEEIRNHNISKHFDNQYIHICALRKDVHEINTQLLGTPTHTFHAKIEGEFNINSMPCDPKLSLRVGARVMTLINYQDMFYNGSLGVVEAICKDSIQVRFDNGTTVMVPKYRWNAYSYVVTNGKITKEIKGSCTQFPLTLAWAITIHKSQGLTFDNVVLHVSNIFCSGQLYVALSRCTSLEGIASDTFIDKRHVIPNPELLRFEKMYKLNNYQFNKESYKLLRYENH